MRQSSVAIGLLVFGLSSVFRLLAQGYVNDFEKASVGNIPEEFLVLEGEFAVREEAGNKFLELPGSPLDSFGIIFGPTHQSGQWVGVRILGTSKGRRSPTFGVGLNGTPGFKLQVSPAKKQIEILRGEVVIASAPFEWASGKWLVLRLQLRQTTKGSHQVEGKAWVQGAEEPKDWLIGFPVTELPPAGRAMIIGSPYSGTPICYDDLKVDKVAK